MRVYKKSLPLEPIKETLAYKSRLLYLKHDTGNDKVRRRDIIGSPISSHLGDADLDTRPLHKLL